MANIIAWLRLRARPAIIASIVLLAGPPAVIAANYQVIGWNEVGVDRLDSGYSVFSLWPPGNNLRAQVVYQGKRLTNSTGITVTYQAVADPDGSINSTSQGKTEFWQYVLPLFGTNLVADMGLNGYGMPGGTTRAMAFNSTNGLFGADGIPMTPFDDALKKNSYPLMRVVVSSNSVALATNDVVLAISDEVSCRVCHASGADAAAQPTNGWVWNSNPERDYRLNILRRHDELRDPATYPGILFSNGYNPAGLYRTVVADGKPVLCVRCHKSNAQPGSGFGGIPPLTQSVHTHHAAVIDPDTGLTLNSSTDRSSCFRCHPGATTHALRGVMGDAISTNGLHAIQCQSCHGSMSLVGATNRIGWIDLPDCQSCHVGNAVNVGSNPIRYSNAFTNYATGGIRQQMDATFATTTNLAFGAYSLYRVSTNHGKLYCSACHGSSHAEFPADRNDNLRVLQVQSHEGMLSDCNACHNTIPTGAGRVGPHGAHEFGQNWVDGTASHIGQSGTVCNGCHGTNERGTILSKSQSDQALNTAANSVFSQKTLFRGAIIGCYLCHSGSGNLTPTPWSAATAADVRTNTASGSPITFKLTVADGNNPKQLTNNAFLVRVITQPANGTVGITNYNKTNWVAVYFPNPGFVGTNTFTFAAWNTYVDSDLYTGTIVVTQGVFSISAKALVPASYPANWSAPFNVQPTASNVVGTVTFDWNFGDASPHSTSQNTAHAYALSGNYNWQVISKVTATGGGSASTTNSGTISITAPMVVSATAGGGNFTLSWPQPTGDALLEKTTALNPANWTVVTNATVLSGGKISVTVPVAPGTMFYRLRQL